MLLSFACDHTSSEDDGRAVAFAVERFGSLDIVHNNAGGPFTGSFETVDDATIEHVLRTNLFGVMQMSRAALPHLRESAKRNHAGSSLLFTSSLQGLKAKPNFSLYTVSKHGIIGLVRSLALELAPHNVRVNALCPTVVATPMLKAFLPGMAADDDGCDETVPRHYSSRPYAGTGRRGQRGAFFGFRRGAHDHRRGAARRWWPNGDVTR